MNINGFDKIRNINDFRPVAIGQTEFISAPAEIRQESFFQLISSICCPRFKFKSTIFILSCLDLLVYLVTLGFGIKISATELLAPEFQTLDLFGMKYPSKIYKGQFHRLILFGLLHANLVHLISNLISQIILGSFLEQLIGPLLAALLYLLSNIGGGLFSCVIDPTPGVGASVAIFGILGGYFGYMLLNWNFLERKWGKFQIFLNLIFIILIVGINVSYGLSNPLIDNYGHLGGLIYGFLLIFMFVQPVEMDDGIIFSYKTWFILMAIILFGLTFTLVYIFWFVYVPK